MTGVTKDRIRAFIQVWRKWKRRRAIALNCKRNVILNTMSDDQSQFLQLRQFPVRLTVQEAAWILGCQPHDIPILVATRLFRPLGNPPPNGIKFFAAKDILAQTKDRSWLAKITNTINQHWRNKKCPPKES